MGVVARDSISAASATGDESFGVIGGELGLDCSIDAELRLRASLNNLRRLGFRGVYNGSAICISFIQGKADTSLETMFRRGSFVLLALF